jgi:hypothetical protein
MHKKLNFEIKDSAAETEDISFYNHPINKLYDYASIAH